MRDRSIAIIGAGVAGLATGCYAQMNGYRTRIFEMHALPGGVCTSWRRDGYTFDGCVQWLMGSRPGSPLNRIWQEFGALTGREIVDHDEFLRIEGRDGRTLVIYADADRLERHLCELAPADAAISHALCEVIRRCAALDQGGGSAGGLATAANWLSSGVRLLPAVPTLVGWLGITWQELAARGLVQSICKRDRRPFVTSVATHPPAHRGPVFPERARPPVADRSSNGAAATRPYQRADYGGR